MRTAPTLRLAVALLLTAGIVSAQPPGLPAPGSSQSAAEPADPMQELQKNVIEGLAGVLSILPDELLSATLKAAEHPDYLSAQEPHPTDNDFNHAAAYLYDEYPELFSLMSSSPLTTDVIGGAAKADQAGMWQRIDQARSSGESAALTKTMMSGGSPPAIQADTSSLEQSLGTTTQAIAGSTSSVNSLTTEVAGVNDNLTEINSEIDEAQEKADEVEEDVESGEYDDEVNEVKALATAAVASQYADSSGGGFLAGLAAGSGGGRQAALSRGFGAMPRGRSPIGGGGAGAAGRGAPMSMNSFKGQKGPFSAFAGKSFGGSESMLGRFGGGRGGISGPGKAGMSPGRGGSRGGPPGGPSGGLGGPGGGGRKSPGGPGGGRGGPGGPGPKGPGPR